MRRQLHSELLKLRTTRTLALLLLASAGITLLGALVEGLSPAAGELAGQEAQRTLFTKPGTTAVFIATLTGLIVVTSEFRYGTIRPTLLFEPRRRVVLAAKLAAAGLTGALLAVLSVGIAYGVGHAVLATRDVEVAATAADAWSALSGTVSAAAVSAMIGVAVGALIRNQAGAIIALATYALAVDAVLFAAVPSLGRYLPGKAGDALVGLPVEHLLTQGTGAAVAVAWLVAFAAAATVRTDRSDV